MEPFVEQLKQICAAHPTRAKWVFVPTHAIGRTIADRLVLEGTDWANLRFVTPLDVALRMGGHPTSTCALRTRAIHYFRGMGFFLRIMRYRCA